VSASPSRGAFSVDDHGVLTASLGTIDAGASASVTVVIQPAQSAIGTTLTSAASVVADQKDLNTANNSTTMSVPVVYAADVGVAIDQSADPILFGDSYQQSITVKDQGPNASPGTQLIYTIPQGTKLVSATYSDVAKKVTVQGANVSVSIGSLPADGSGVLTV